MTFSSWVVQWTLAQEFLRLSSNSSSKSTITTVYVCVYSNLNLSMDSYTYLCMHSVLSFHNILPISQYLWSMSTAVILTSRCFYLFLPFHLLRCLVLVFANHFIIAPFYSLPFYYLCNIIAILFTITLFEQNIDL